TETRPLLVIEVLSPSTATTDRTEKRLNYQRLESLGEYVLVAQDEMRVEVYRRQEDDWTHTAYGRGDEVELSSIDLRLALSLIYEDVIGSSGDP
ncbi:MAG: Uma2 family endonuclease, partial [Candidatus Competibacteraceae bacterium]|nr:Uma2 family endonuclease [Candidatus Competibacteraceae bacterium]